VTASAARTTAQAVLAAAGLAAAYVIVTTPSLRRLAKGTTRLWLGSNIPAYLLREVGRAWTEAGATEHRQSANDDRSTTNHR
jgi:hypothetical protein